MFCNCKKLKKELIARGVEVDLLHKQMAYLQGDFRLLLEHLKLEVNNVPATERKRVIVKLGTHAKKMAEVQVPTLPIPGYDCTCRGALIKDGQLSFHSNTGCSSKPDNVS